MSEIPEQITISLDDYLELDRKAADWDSMVKRLAEAEKKYFSVYADLERLAPMGGSAVLKTADGLMCYMAAPIDLHHLEIRRPVLPSVGAMRAMREDLDFDKVMPKYRTYRMTWQTTAHGLRIYEEAAE